MNFEIINTRYFKAGIDYHLRVYRVESNRNGGKRLVNSYTGEVLYDDLQSYTISGGGDLQDVVFNAACVCDLTENKEVPFRYFDNSFDQTFE